MTRRSCPSTMTRPQCKDTRRPQRCPAYGLTSTLRAGAEVETPRSTSSIPLHWHQRIRSRVSMSSYGMTTALEPSLARLGSSNMSNSASSPAGEQFLFPAASTVAQPPLALMQFEA